MTYIQSYKAINYGLSIVVIAALIFMIFGIISGIYFVEKYDIHPMLIFLVFVPVSILAYWPFWSFLLVKWRIWSYKRVDELNSFNQLAVKRGLIFPPDSIYCKYEFIFKKDKKLEKDILDKRRTENSLEILLNTIGRKRIIVRSTKSYFMNFNLIEISIEGVQLTDKGFYNWGKFSKFEMRWKTFDKYRSPWIKYKLKNENFEETLDLENININYTKLEYYIENFKKLYKYTNNRK